VNQGHQLVAAKVLKKNKPGKPACKAWLYLNCADLPQLAGAITSSAKDVRPQVPFLAISGH